ncbi:RNase H1/viroplasmin domain-containing protein [Alteromonas lipotrueae]|uniref:RNase H1/viroplasmin domain-containing protein n=1 Tax=Alteromonas lipotrueae TaxID=2803814 RepID=UPI001C4465D8|nr:RNase H1/viroplasmin domain-containing protein [Alteromonas lipotrueae]
MSRCFSNYNFTSKYAAYVVFKGRKPGVYKTWKETKALVNSYSGNRYQGFPSLAEAKRAYRRFLDDGKIVLKAKRKTKQKKPLKPNMDKVDLPPWELD